MNVTLVDYGIGNVLSVQRALEHVGAAVSFPESPEDIVNADRVVVPGVGAFRRCMEALDSRGFRAPLLTFAESGRPYLGICVGMQMLLDTSEEFGQHPGLGLVPGRVRRIDVPNERVPFIGWKRVELADMVGKFYFVHSYTAEPESRESVWATYRYGERDLVAAVRQDNVVGVQFHPEKSAESGLEFLHYFLKQ